MSIFKRGQKQSALKKIKEALWPTMGWMRTFHYYRHRIFRTGDSTYKITAGLASGISLSFTPFLGTHILQTLAFSWLIRANLVAGLVGTIAGNPWTYPVIFITAYKLGMWVCMLFGLQDFAALPYDEIIASADHDPRAFLSYMLDHPLKILLLLTVGGYLCAALFWPVFYLLLYYPLRALRIAYIHQRRRKRGKPPL